MKSNARDPATALRLLGCVFLDEQTWSQVSRLTFDDFPDAVTREIFAVLSTLAGRRDALTRANVAEVNRDAYMQFDAAEKNLYPKASLSDVSNISSYIERLREDRIKREANHEILQLAERIDRDGKLGAEDYRRIGEFATQLDPAAAPTVANLCLNVADLPLEALDGGLGEICTTHMGGFPRCYAWGALLANASATIPRDPEKPRTNIYVVQAGPVGSGKTQSQEWAKDLLGVLDSSLITAFVGSGEQLAAITDCGGNARLFAPDEFSNTLKKMQIERATLGTVFSRAFYHDDFAITQPKRGPKKQEPARFHCHLSSIGGIVDSDFEQLFGADSETGFYDRQLFVLCPTNYGGYHYRPFPAHLKAKWEEAARVPSVAADVWDTLREWRQQTGLNREVEISFRAALIAASYDRRKILRSDDLKPAKALLDYQKRIRALLRPNAGQTPEGRITEAMMSQLKRLAPGEGVTQKVLFDKANVYRLGVSTAVRVLKLLVAGDNIIVSPGKRIDSKLYSLPRPKDGDIS